MYSWVADRWMKGSKSCSTLLEVDRSTKRSEWLDGYKARRLEGWMVIVEGNIVVAIRLIVSDMIDMSGRADVDLLLSCFSFLFFTTMTLFRVEWETQEPSRSNVSYR